MQLARFHPQATGPPEDEATRSNRAGRNRRLSRTEPEELAGTSWDVLSTVYDDLSEEDLRDAIRRLETG